MNVKVPFFLVAELAPAMAARGKGSIINVTTMVAQFGQPGMALYGSSKAALVLLTKAWAAEYGPSGVRVNAVSPGPTRTEGTAPMGEALDQLAATPHGKPGTPDDIAAAITTSRLTMPPTSTARSCRSTAAAPPSEQHHRVGRGPHRARRPRTSRNLPPR